MPSKKQMPYINQVCDTCEYGFYDEPISGQEWHVVCNECEAIRMCYDPLPHQAAFHADNHKYKMFAGGYGSGKTTTACMETIDHILTTPNGTTLIGAETLPQLEQTAMKEFFEVFPAELIPKNGYNKQKNYIDLDNGHRVIFRPLDSEQKARSLNLTFFWIEEANGVNFSYFTQLQTRLRNDATDFQRGILSTNPDQNWVKTEIVLKAHKIYNADEKYPQTPEDIDINISVHIAPTHLNTHLPATFYEDTARGKPEWWIKRYLHGSFVNKEGLVYPMYADHIVEPFEIPKHWKRRIGGDFGLSNPTAFSLLATDPETGTTYIYDEHRKAQKPVSYHAEKLLNKLETLPYGVLETMVGDAAGQQKTAGDLSSVFDHYAEYGVYWSPSTKKVEDSILKMYGYLEAGKLKIFETCVETVKEISTYKYPERTIDKEVKNEDIFEKPIKENDHLMDAVRYAVAEMPDNAEALVNKSYNAQHVINNAMLQKKTSLPKELQVDDDLSYNRSDAWILY